MPMGWTQVPMSAWGYLQLNTTDVYEIIIQTEYYGSVNYHRGIVSHNSEWHYAWFSEGYDTTYTGRSRMAIIIDSSGILREWHENITIQASWIRKSALL